MADGKERQVATNGIVVTRNWHFDKGNGMLTQGMAF